MMVKNMNITGIMYIIIFCCCGSPWGGMSFCWMKLEPPSTTGTIANRDVRAPLAVQ